MINRSNAVYCLSLNCGCRQVVRPGLPKPVSRVRVPSPAPSHPSGADPRDGARFASGHIKSSRIFQYTFQYAGRLRTVS